MIPRYIITWLVTSLRISPHSCRTVFDIVVVPVTKIDTVNNRQLSDAADAPRWSPWNLPGTTSPPPSGHHGPWTAAPTPSTPRDTDSGATHRRRHRPCCRRFPPLPSATQTATLEHDNRGGRRGWRSAWKRNSSAHVDRDLTTRKKQIDVLQLSAGNQRFKPLIVIWIQYPL